MSHTVTLTTDFGLSDPYVAAMKGVILRLAPHATVVDICHDIPAHDISTGSFILGQVCHYFAAGTIHVAVVDPGVGTERRPVAIHAGGYVFVGPDNGVFSFIWERQWQTGAQAVHLMNDVYWLPQPSSTFHGRDIFAPVAAHLARGVSLECLGLAIPIESLVRLPFAEPRVDGQSIVGIVVHVDRFGNLITNVPADLLAGSGIVVEIGSRRIHGLSRAYAEKGKGELVALIGSSGRLEIAAMLASAADLLGLGRGAQVRIVTEQRHGI